MKTTLKSSLGFLAISLISTSVALAQETVAPVEAKQDSSAQWQVGLDMTSIVVGFMGGNSDYNLHAGLQAKRIKGNGALRLTAEYYPQSASQSFFPSNPRVIAVEGNNVRYLTQNHSGDMVRVGLGFEKGKQKRFGRAYFGLDAFANMEWLTVSTSSYWRDIDGDKIDWDDWMNSHQHLSTRSIGGGLSPLVGYEFHFWNHFGVNVEAKVDVSMMTGKGYGVDFEDGSISTSGTLWTFRTMPLLNLRFHYRS